MLALLLALSASVVFPVDLHIGGGREPWPHKRVRSVGSDDPLAPRLAALRLERITPEALAKSAVANGGPQSIRGGSGMVSLVIGPKRTRLALTFPERYEGVEPGSPLGLFLAAWRMLRETPPSDSNRTLE
jgi:hypothetical protein